MLDQFEHEDELDKSVEIIGSGFQANSMNEAFVDLNSAEEINDFFKLKSPKDQKHE